MRYHLFYKTFISIALSLYALGAFCLLLSPPAHAKGVKTSYKRYSIFKYKSEDVLCEPYIVNQDDWLYKIFRKKGEISEKDFPHFIIIFKEINPQISNIDAIEPGNPILIPLKKVVQGDYEQSTPGNIDVPVIEFSIIPQDLDLKRYVQKHDIQKGETISELIDKDFLKKDGSISEEGLRALQLANPNIKNINIVYEGQEIYLPDPSIKSQPWFQSFLTDKTEQAEPLESEPAETEPTTQQLQIDAYKLKQLKKYSSLIGGTLLSHGKMYFPGDNDSRRVLDLSLSPVIETGDGSKILIITGDTISDELLKSVQTYWKNLKTQLITETINEMKNTQEIAAKKNMTTEHKNTIRTLLAQTNYEYLPDAKIPFMLNNIRLEASFGRVIRKDSTDLLINFGNVYGAALEVLEKREFEIISIIPQLTALEIAEELFSHLGYATWANPTFSTGEIVEKIEGLYAVRELDKLFVRIKPLTNNAMNYLMKEDIKILTLKDQTSSQ